MKMNRDGGYGKVGVLEPPGFQRYCASEALFLCLLKWYKKWSVGELAGWLCIATARKGQMDRMESKGEGRSCL